MTPKIRNLVDHFTRFATLYAGLGFGLGLLVGKVFDFAPLLRGLLDLVVDSYGLVAPWVIFLILAPTLLEILGPGGRQGFSTQALWWFVRVRILACLFAVAAVALAFGLPWTGHGGSALSSMKQSASQLGTLLVTSPYFLAIYLSVIAAFLLRSVDSPWVDRFRRLPELLEAFGELLTAVVPVFTFLVGIHVITLPGVLAEALEGATYADISLFGIAFGSSNAEGIFWLYLAVSFLTGAISTTWHGCLLLEVRRRLPEFSFGHYFRDYFAKIYPLLWATSSEALATPLNLHLVQQLRPKVDDDLRRFTVGIGSILNINGTLTCCFVMVPAVMALLGQPIGIFDLLLCYPVIFLIGFGVPGIPGELVLFAGPIMTVLAVPEPAQGAFLMTFLGLQVGLPDSFRTGANSTDEAPSTLILDHRYRQYLRQSARDGSPVLPPAEIEGKTP